MSAKILLAAFVSMPLLASCIQGQGCRLQVVSQDPHSAWSQKIHVEMEEIIRSRPASGNDEVNAVLVVSQLELTREGVRNGRMFYVLTDGGGRLLDASTCDVGEGRCASIIVERMTGFCE